jgi:peroxiredoxin Q/BCP
MLKVGDTAPLDIPLVDENGHSFTLRDLLGSWVVVYFYPKDSTPGCTLEAQQFRDNEHAFTQLGAKILGVSKDTYSSHQKFIGKHKLTFTLVSDTEHTLMEAFGTWGEKKFMGRTYMGTSRSTFLVDQQGIIVHVWEKVKPLGHAQEVRAVLRTVSADYKKTARN